MNSLKKMSIDYQSFMIMLSLFKNGQEVQRQPLLLNSINLLIYQMKSSQLFIHIRLCRFYYSIHQNFLNQLIGEQEELLTNKKTKTVWSCWAFSSVAALEGEDYTYTAKIGKCE